VVACERDVVGMTLEGGDKRLGSVVPHLDRSVIGSSENVGFVGVRVVIDVVDALCLMRFKCEIRCRRAEVPDLHGAVETRRSESVGILRVDGQTHDIMAVAFEDLNAFPALVPVPKLDGHVIGGGEDERLSRVDGDGTDVIGMRLERRDLLGSVVIVNT
jgi:hypothetical protein